MKKSFFGAFSQDAYIYPSLPEDGSFTFNDRADGDHTNRAPEISSNTREVFLWTSTRKAKMRKQLEEEQAKKASQPKQFRVLEWFSSLLFGPRKEPVEEEEDYFILPRPHDPRLLPTIFWPPPTLEYPHPLDETSLNAVCYYYNRSRLLEGEFLYSYPAGTGF